MAALDSKKQKSKTLSHQRQCGWGGWAREVVATASMCCSPSVSSVHGVRGPGGRGGRVEVLPLHIMHTGPADYWGRPVASTCWGGRSVRVRRYQRRRRMKPFSLRERARVSGIAFVHFPSIPRPQLSRSNVSTCTAVSECILSNLNRSPFQRFS